MRRGNAGQIGQIRAVQNGGVISLSELQQARSTPYAVQVLQVAAGGAGGFGTACGGGSAGELAEYCLKLTPGQSYTATIGAGGICSSTPTAGGDTVFAGNTCKGGGPGGVTGGQAASRGGGSARDGSGSTATKGMTNSLGGFSGAPGDIGVTVDTGGGGSGATGNGLNQNHNVRGGDGGPGWLTNITGTFMPVAAGGAGSGNGGPGGIGGSNSTGGNGAPGATDPVANTGSGGGAGTNGADGVLYIKYAGSQRFNAGTVTTDNGFTIHKIVSSVTFVA